MPWGRGEEAAGAVTDATAAPKEQGFFARGGRDFVRRGLLGDKLEVFCFGDTLELRGEGGGRLAIPAGRVERLRLDVGGSRAGTFYVARVFLAAEPEPLLLITTHSGGPGYAEPMRRFAAAVVAARGQGALEHGGTRGGAIAAFACTALATGGASIVALTVWAEQRGMGPALAFVAAMIALTAVLGWRFLYRDMPGPLHKLEEIDTYLPKR